MKTNSKKRVKRYSNSLKKAPIIEPHSYYSSDVHKNLKEINSLDVRYNGVTYKTVLNQLQDRIQELNEIKNTVRGCEDLLTGVLDVYGYKTPNTNLNALIGDISKLNIIIPNVEYIGYKIDNTYVVGYGYDLICVKSNNQPDDFDKGYWRFDGNAWSLDEDKYKAMWNAVR